MITLSKILNNQTNVEKYSQLYDQLAEEFHISFYNSTLNGYAEGLQTANVLALKLPQVVPSNLRPTVIKSLVDNILNNSNHSTSGIIGCAALYPVLSDAGYHDLAVTIATQTTYPSFGYMFNNDIQNATTTWESFHSLLPGETAFESLNHHMFNSIGAWFYRYLAGIQLNGFVDDLIIHSRLATLLTNIDAEVHTIFGSILVSWQRNTEDHSVIYNITVPNALHSIITFEPISPSAHCISIEESQTLVWDQSSPILKTEMNGIDWIRIDSDIQGAMKVRVQGGSYHWKIQWD
jgi:alpha-L-rhamnosidase